MQQHNLSTTFVHAGRKKRFSQGSVNPVLQRASSLVFDSIEDKKHATQHRAKGELFYGRRGTLTHFALQDLMCEMEGGAGCYLYPCGAAAVTNSILSFVKTGDHVLMSGAAYEPTQDFCNIVLKKMQIDTTYYDPLIGADIATLIQPNTKVLFLEAPSSITMEIPDIPTIVKAARKVNPNIVIMIDNTWSAGVLFKALEHDIDISIQAGTKYLVGHSDIMIGTAVANARLKQHQESSIKVAKWLSEQPEVKTVYHPALPSCPGHEFFLRDFSGSSGLFSFELTKRLTSEQVSNFMDHFQLFTMAYSWGGFESLILCNQPEEIAHIRPNIKRNLTGSLIRVHIGFEDVDELIADLKAGFERIA